jgi:hypothetical protein
MMRHLAEKQAALWGVVNAITSGDHVRDGCPKAQARLVSRIKAAGASNVQLTPGKRGRYVITVQSLVGWARVADEWIKTGSEIPHKPWLAVGHLDIQGLGRGLVKNTLSIACLISHHSMSRTCQRWAVRTVPELVRVIETIEAAVRRCAREINLESPNDWQQKIPPKELRYPVNSSATMVLQWYERRGIPFVATIIGRGTQAA